jgi:hypothetical protein
MPKLLNGAPRYRRHKATGQAVVRLEGRDIYLGKHGTAASREAYKRFVAQWSQSGGKLPTPKHAATVTEIVVSYTEFASTYYRKDGKPTDVKRTFPFDVYAVQEGSGAEAEWIAFFAKVNVKWYDEHGFLDDSTKGLVRLVI